VVRPPNKRLVLWTVGTVIALLILGSIVGAWLLWGVLSGYIQPKTPTDKKDLVNIFVLIAAGVVGTLTALAAVVNLYFSRMNLQNARETMHQQRVLNDRQAQDEAIQAYLEEMTRLMRDKDAPLRSSGVGDEVRTLARAHTLTVLRRLYPDGKRNVLNFLYEADLIHRAPPPAPPQAPIQPPQPVIDLGSLDFEYNAADLSKAKLIGAVLRLADLSGPTNGANLSRADLRGADLRGADLSHATLRGADLSGALLSSELRYADLRGAHLIGTEFTGANLWGAQLSGAYFRRPEGSTQQYADELREAGLPDERIEQAIRGQTNLTNAMLNEVRGITNEEVAKQTPLLSNATMPDGQKYEDWLKDKEGSGKDVENE
jgi:uncharacterized protein YjbI with pentapeptide repeats